MSDHVDGPVQRLIERINEAIQAKEVTDFQICSFQNDSLLLIGSFNLAYYHDLEVRFHKVTYINLPVYGIDSPIFSIATKLEQEQHAQLDLQEETLFRIVSSPELFSHPYFIAAEQISISEKRVHYQVSDNEASPE
ncbi:hypothetical protein [Stratiformator vulcanicus]|uniref:Uncharacterized protein n=1 Tax=Stratiformator vulcanicus TaxID=2527980 RepID=A0A517QXA0_9PLAN|nr:hypothetical protein [Stratiformator vulcanicus]QDT36261.1 hypothetical protein Pan189_06160 [Stratiformator vulcanicus]